MQNWIPSSLPPMHVVCRQLILITLGVLFGATSSWGQLAPSTSGSQGLRPVTGGLPSTSANTSSSNPVMVPLNPTRNLDLIRTLLPRILVAMEAWRAQCTRSRQLVPRYYHRQQCSNRRRNLSQVQRCLAAHFQVLAFQWVHQSRIQH